MNDIHAKYNKLNHVSKKEVDDLINFLLKNQHLKKPIKSSEYKKAILNVSIWEEDDMSDLNQSINRMNQWKVENW